MAKILITSLGTGRKEDSGYRKVRYEIDGKIYEESFIAKVLTDHFKIDKVFMIGTSKSIWDSVYSAFGGKDEDYELDIYDKKENSLIVESDLVELNNQLNIALSTIGSQCHIVKYGINPAELMDNFNIFINIGNQLEEGDEVYLDITHSFRSLAMMSFIMLEFAKEIKNRGFVLKGVFYGMLEYLEEKTNINKTAPIVDLSIFFEMMDWIKAVNSFKLNGDAFQLLELLDSKEDFKREELKKELRHFSDATNMANLSAVRQYVQRVKEKLVILEHSESVALSLLSKDIIDFVTRLDKNNFSEFQLEMAKWFYENRKYGLSYLALAESIVSKICELKGYENKVNDFDIRKAAKETWIKDHEIFCLYHTINKIRNNVAHQTNKGGDAVISNIENLNIYIAKVEKFLKS